MIDYTEPFSWWGGQWSQPQPQTVVELIRDGVLDAPLAGLLWSALARRATVVVASGPQSTGKTTVLTALLDFIPQPITRLFLRGWHENFEFAGRYRPERSYLLVNEISDHLPNYLWGPKVVDLFDLLDEGWRMATTLHADTLGQIVQQLTSRDVGITTAQVAAIDLVLFVKMGIHSGKVMRRVTSVVVPFEDASGKIQAFPLADFPPGGAMARIHTDAAQLLAGRLGGEGPVLQAEATARANYLHELIQRQNFRNPGVRDALNRYSPPA